MLQPHTDNSEKLLHNQLFKYTLPIKFTHMLNVSVSYITKQSMSNKKHNNMIHTDIDVIHTKQNRTNTVLAMQEYTKGSFHL